MTEAQSSQVPVGTLLEGKFRVTQEIGRGGMAAVYEAENIDIGKRVAVKILSPELISSRIVRERFIREARSAAAIHSPYICEVYDSGMYYERPFLVMELLDGESLYDRMTRIRQLRVATCLKVLRHIVRGLAKAHEAGVVHRDLKPENIFLTRDADGRLLAKIVDFGLAKFYESRDGEEEKNVRLTREGALFGTPAYMSPEQARGQGEVDHRADLWALGCIVYECLTGRTVWDVQQGVAMILAQIARGNLPDPREFRPDLPESFTHWFHQALHPDLNERFQTGRAFLNSLEEALRDSNEPVSSSDPLVGVSSYDIPDPSPILTDRPPASPAPATAGGTTGRSIAWLAITATCVLSGYAFWLYVLHPPERPAITHSAVSEKDFTPAPPPPAEPSEKGPGAELINRAQKQLRSDQHADALSTLRLAEGENPNVAGSLIKHAEVAFDSAGSCRLAAMGRPRPFESSDGASHPRLDLGSQGILALWTDSHQDPKRRNVYSALLDDSLRRVSPPRNATPEATTAIQPVLSPIHDGFVALYWDSGPSEPGVYVRSIESDGRIRSGATLLSGGRREKYFPTLTALPGDNLLAVWSAKTDDAQGRSAIVARRINKESKPEGDPLALTALLQGDATQPYAQVHGDTLFIVYRYLVPRKTSEIRLLRISLNDPALKNGVEPNSNEDRWAGQSVLLRTEPRQANPSTTCDDLGCLVVWDDEQSGAFAGYVPHDRDTPLWYREFSTKGRSPIITEHPAGGAAVAFYAGDRVFLAPIDRDGVGSPSVVSRVSGVQPAPSLSPGALPGEWLLAWRDFEAGHLEVFVARMQCSTEAAR